MLYRFNCYIGTWLFLLVSASSNLYASTKVFTGVVEESIVIERVYEVHEVHFKIVSAEANDSFLVNGIIKGEAGLDAISGRMIINIQELNKAGMSMKAVGYVESEDGEKGIPACTLWQTRMFEESKLCYAATLEAGKAYKVVVSINDEGEMPVAAGQ